MEPAHIAILHVQLAIIISVAVLKDFIIKTECVSDVIIGAEPAQIVTHVLTAKILII
jgi:hypothetical protein